MTIKVKSLFYDFKKNIFNSDGLKTTFFTSIVKGFGIFFGICLSLFLGNNLGADGLGIINLSHRIATILLIFCLLGLPTVVVKETSIAVSRQNWFHINSVIKTSLFLCLITGVLFVGFFYFLSEYVTENIFHDPRLKLPLLIALFAIFFQIISRIFAAGSRGYYKIWQSSLVDNVLSLALVLIILLLIYAFKYEITVINVAWVYAISRIIVAIFITNYFNSVKVKIDKYNFIPKQLLIVSIPLLLVKSTKVISISIDSLMIGNFLTTSEVGIYSISVRIAMVSSIFLQITNAVLGPKIASMYANGKTLDLELLVQKVTRILFIVSIITTLIIILFGKNILSFWGVDFISGYYPLIILSVGQIFNISMGCIGLFMIMCDQQNIWGVVTIFSALLNIVLNYFLIQFYGINGAAFATSATIIILNITGYFLVKKRIGIKTIKLI